MRHHRWRKATFAGFTLSHLALPLVQTSGATVDEVVAAEMKNHGIPGLSLAIIDNGKIIRAKAYGFTDKTRATAVTTNTLFQAASISKPVAALAALRLVEEGRLSLDEDVNRALKLWKLPENEFTKDQKVTLRRILTHSAGLTVPESRGYDRNSPLPTLRQLLDGSGPANTSAIRVDAVPGSTQRYSGAGYTVMQQMMIDVTAKTFQELVKETVLSPLQMNASTYKQPATGAATGYYSNGEELEERWRIYPELAAAGLWTTPSDLARLAISIQEGFAGRSNPVISESMTRQMLTVQQGNSGLADLGGLGVGVEGTGKTLRLFQGGRNAGFDSLLLAYAELGSGVVIMFNANDNSGVMMRIVNAVSKEHHWPGAD